MKNRKSQSAVIRFGPALKALFLCLLIAGSAVGFVWQKSQIYQLGQQILQREIRLKQLKDTNQKLSDQLAMLCSPPMLDRRSRELNLGLGPAQPSQIWRLPEPSTVSSGDPDAARRLAARHTGATTQ
jgi:cell division protein FtsB